MTNAFCLVGSYITAGPMCPCWTNRLGVLKQQRMARVMTNCINKTFITLNILATKSQLPWSKSEHPPPRSYSSHNMSAMHKLAFFCHVGGSAGSVVCFARDETRGELMADDCKSSFLANQETLISSFCVILYMMHVLVCGYFVCTFHECILVCVHTSRELSWLTNALGLRCARTLLLHCVLPTVISLPLISHLPLKQQPVSRTEQYSGPSSSPSTHTSNEFELGSRGSPIRPTYFIQTAEFTKRLCVTPLYGKAEHTFSIQACHLFMYLAKNENADHLILN